MVFHQIVGACAADRVVGSDPVEVVARWTTAVGHHPDSTSRTVTSDELLGASDGQLPKGRVIVAYAEALAADAPGSAFAGIVGMIDALDPSGADPELAEVRELCQLAANVY